MHHLSTVHYWTTVCAMVWGVKFIQVTRILHLVIYIQTWSCHNKGAIKDDVKDAVWKLYW